MTATEGKLPVGESGEDLDTTIVEQTDGSLTHREAIVLTDPEDNDARASVTAGVPELAAYGGTVHDPMIESIDITLKHILEELRAQRVHLNYMTEIDK